MPSVFSVLFDSPTHHIDTFPTSLNNDFENIMVLCPNHHRIIHIRHGDFQRAKSDIWHPNCQKLLYASIMLP